MVTITQKELAVIARKFAKDFLANKDTDVRIIYDFLDTFEVDRYIWWDLMKVWGEDLESFDVFYNTLIWKREFNISVEFIERLNNTENEEKIMEELVTVADRIKDNIIYINKQLKKC